MKIGIDIDNTICSTNKVVSRLYNKSHDNEFKSLSKIEQYKFCAKNEKKIFDDCPLEDNAKQVINYLFQKHEIFLITARTEKYVKSIKTRTINYLNKHDIKYKEIYFELDSKIDIYKELNLDIMLDDDYDVYEEITKNGLKAVMYNGDLNENKEGIRVNNWLEFKEYIERMNFNG